MNESTSESDALVVRLLAALKSDGADSPVVRQLVDEHPSLHDALSALQGFEGIVHLATSEESLRPGQEIGGLVVRELVGRGGMGEVWRAYEGRLGRHLAVKVLRPGLAALPAARRRFLDEARITARLQHPGVVPVHDVGSLPDGNPYLVLKLVEGKTLARLLADRETSDDDLMKHVQIFQQVAQTVGYAHAQRVCHRDLKPGNIMVGAFGEVQVMDWGLAIDRSVADTSTASATESGEPAAETPPKSTDTNYPLGTYAYMPPEQASGLFSDERSDVFSLGGILCEILTGAPPYWSDSGDDALRRAEVRRQCEQSDLESARSRLSALKSHRELVQLSLSCLSRDPKDRPRDAGVVAEAAAAYQSAVETRLRRKEIDEAKATERRRRMWAVSALILAAATACGLGFYSWDLRAKRAVERTQSAVADLDRAARLRDSFRWEEAAKAIESAGRTLAAEDAVVRGRADSAARDLAFAKRLAEIRQNRAREVRELTTAAEAPNRLVGGRVDEPWDDEDSDASYERAFLDAFQVAVGSDLATAAGRLRDCSAASQMISALDDWAGAAGGDERRYWILRLARSVSDDVEANRFRDPAAWSDPLKRKELFGQAVHTKLPSALAFTLVRHGDTTTTRRTAHLRELLRNDPKDYWLNLQLGLALETAKQPESPHEAIGFLKVAEAVGGPSAAISSAVGRLYFKIGNIVDSAEHLLRAIRMEPAYARAHFSMARTAARLRTISAADPSFAAEVRRKLEQVAQVYGVVGAGRQIDAIEVSIAGYKRAIECRPNYAEACNNLGYTYYQLGRLDDAVKEFRRAHEIKPSLTEPLVNIVEVEASRDRYDDAKRAAVEAPQSILIPALMPFGNRFLSVGKYDAAAVMYRIHTELRPGESWAWFNLALARRYAGRWEEGVAPLKAALQLEPNNAGAWGDLGETYMKLNRSAEAIAAYRRMIELEPKESKFWVAAVKTLGSLKLEPEAKKAAARALEVLPKSDAARKELLKFIGGE